MIDLCVVNYNTKDLLKRFLDSLHSDVNEQNKIWNLYVCDNGSSDGSWSWIEQNRSSYQITAGWNNDNIGYSAACNGMASYSSGDIICLLNADVWLTTNDLVKVQNIFDSNPDIHILGPKQRDENGFITHAGIVGTNTAPAHRGWRQHDPNDVLFKDRIDCVTVSGSAYFIRRSVWEALRYDSEYAKMYPGALGAFLPTPHYYEETWCSYFARHRGYKVVYDGSVSIGHSWHASSPKPGKGYSHADVQFKTSQSIFRKACDTIGIERD
jgi:GT2 family glycosyltransferase